MPHRPESFLKSGFDSKLTRAVRAAETVQGLARTPIIAWTANALPEEIDHCTAAGMDTTTGSNCTPLYSQWHGHIFPMARYY